MRSRKILDLAELSLILLWALWVGQDYLNFDVRVWPHGGDFPLTIQSFYQWPLAFKCGACVFWNGSINGGVPAFADSFTGFLHPLPAVASLLFGVINGSKLTLIASLIVAGLAQWWIARMLGFGSIPRLWTAAIAVSGGHLSGRMEIGLLGMVLSTAFGSLALAAGLNLALNRNRRAALLLGALLTLSLLSGQGYIQVALFVAMTTLVLVFVVRQEKRLLREFLLSAGLALLLSAVFWIPFVQFLPHFGKAVDTSYSAGQSFQYIPLNYVIGDADFYRGDALGRILFPSIYMNYIGWMPILLSAVGLPLLWKTRRRVTLALVIPILLIVLASSANSVQFAAKIFPDLMASLRYPPLLLGLTIPFILALAAAGVDQILQIPWPSLTLLWEGAKIRLPSLTLLVLMGWSMRSTFDFSQSWYTPFWPPAETLELPHALETNSAQWVQPPGQHYWMPDLLASNQKITGVFRPWWWSGREAPEPFLQAVSEDELPEDSTPIGQIGSLKIIANSASHYAFIEIGNTTIPCRAVSNGGNIDVSCNSPEQGQLTVREYSGTGWSVSMDGTPGRLTPSAWLSTAAQAGNHDYSFRYRPRAAQLGVGLSIFGSLLMVWLWRRSRQFPDSY
jgi:hypothetical protein